MNKFALRKEFYSSLNLIRKISNGEYTRLTKTAQSKRGRETKSQEALILLPKVDLLINKINSKKPVYKYLLTAESAKEIKDMISKLVELQSKILALSSLLTKSGDRMYKKQMLELAARLKRGANRIIANTGNGLTELSQLQLGARDPSEKSNYAALYARLNALIKSYEDMRLDQVRPLTQEEEAQFKSLTSGEDSFEELPSAPTSSLTSTPSLTYAPQGAGLMTKDQAESQLRQTGTRFVDSIDDTYTRSSGSLPGPTTR